MIRAVALCALFALPAQAESQAECEAFASRIPNVTVERSRSLSHGCLFHEVTVEIDAQTHLGIRKLSLLGTLEDLPTRVPARLTGVADGIGPAAEIPGQPGLSWLIRESGTVSGSLAFDLSYDDGVLAINQLRFSERGLGHVAVTAKLLGVPADPRGANPLALVLSEATLEAEFKGLFEAIVLMPLGAAVLETTQPIPAQIDALRGQGLDWLAMLESAGAVGPAAGLRGFLEALPRPRGVLRVGLAGDGLSAPLALTLGARPDPEGIARLAEILDLQVTWTSEPTE